MKTCTYCGHQNEDTVLTCSGCGKVLKPPAATKAAGDLVDAALDPVIVGTFENTEHAGVLKTELEAAGIEAWIPEDFSIEFPPQSASVQVAAKDALAAGKLAAEFRRSRGLPSGAPHAHPSPGAEQARSTVGGQPPNTRVCVSCGAPISYDALLCPNCGWTQPQMA